MANVVPGAAGSSAWNPGVSSRIPREFQLLETLYRAEHVFPSFELVEDAARMTGLPHEELAMFRPARLALHEVIVRITADIAVAEGASEEVFGQNFRHIAERLLADYVAPQMPALERMHAELAVRTRDHVRALLDARLGPAPAAPRRGFLARILGRRERAPVAVESAAEREHRVIYGFKAAGLAAADPFERAVFKSLYRVLGAILATRGHLGADHDLIAELVTRHVCNSLGSRMIGRAIAPSIEAAIAREGYARIPNRAAPVLVSLKGPSAAGKSSIRPMVKRLLLDSGIEADGYATISPDVWRRLLLDYDSLGAAYKYAGQFTSRELVVVDGKLDRYIRDKANQARAIPHFLVDRFRFDSFSSKEVGRILQDTYTKYVSAIHMYFVVTPPEETVERGWQRALERGRYKAVDDFLAHCVEAYEGMPKLLFKWLGYRHIDYRYHFLDNRVPRGAFPTPIATGDRGRMTIYDPEGLVNIDRYQKIDINAGSRAEVYPAGPQMAVAHNTAFLRQCLRRIPVVTFRDGPAGRAYLEFRGGAAEVLDPATLARVAGDPTTASILREIAPGLVSAPPPPPAAGAGGSASELMA